MFSLHAHGAGVPHRPGVLKFFVDINSDSIRDPKPWTSILRVSIALEDPGQAAEDYSHGMRNKMQMLSPSSAQPNILLQDESR